MGRPSKPLTREMLENAMAKTPSNRAAARYLSVSFEHYKKWAKLYKDNETGQTFWEKHKNQAGAGIPKYLSGPTGREALQDILDGKATADSWKPEKLKRRLVVEGYLKEECAECGLTERRVLDYKMPLLLKFADGNKKNYALDNISLLCYNCYFFTVGDVFEDRQIQGMEDHVEIRKQETPTWELDDYQLERLRELGLEDPIEEEDDFISRL